MRRPSIFTGMARQERRRQQPFLKVVGNAGVGASSACNIFVRVWGNERGNGVDECGIPCRGGVVHGTGGVL